MNPIIYRSKVDAWIVLLLVVVEGAVVLAGQATLLLGPVLSPHSK